MMKYLDVERGEEGIGGTGRLAESTYNEQYHHHPHGVVLQQQDLSQSVLIIRFQLLLVVLHRYYDRTNE